MKRCWASILHSTGLASRSCRHGANRPNIYNFQKKIKSDSSTCYFGFKIHTQVAWVHFQIKPPSMISCRFFCVGATELMCGSANWYWWTSGRCSIYIDINIEHPHVLLQYTILYESSSFNGHSIHIYEHWTSPCATAVGHIFSVSNQILIIIIIWHIWIRECSSPSQQNIVTLFKYQNDECPSVLAMMKTKEHISRPVLVNRSDGR